MTDADRFSSFVYISIAGHFVIALMVFFKTVLAPTEHIDLRDAIRVDIAGLPKKIETLPDKAPAPAPPKAAVLPPKAKETPKPKAPEIPSPKAKKPDTKAAEKKALEKLKAMEALDKIKDEIGKEKSAKPQ